jgi:outer membrane protein TolC
LQICAWSKALLNASYKAERALIFPSIGLAATAGFVPAGPQTVPGQFGAIGVNVSIPVFNGGSFKARRTEAELKARAAAQNVDDLANRVIRDVRVAYLNAATAYERVSLTAQLLQQAQLALDLAQSRYDLGLSSIVELSQSATGSHFCSDFEHTREVRLPDAAVCFGLPNRRSAIVLAREIL